MPNDVLGKGLTASALKELDLANGHGDDEREFETATLASRVSQLSIRPQHETLEEKRYALGFAPASIFFRTLRSGVFGFINIFSSSGSARRQSRNCDERGGWKRRWTKLPSRRNRQGRSRPHPPIEGTPRAWPRSLSWIRCFCKGIHTDYGKNMRCEFLQKIGFCEFY